MTLDPLQPGAVLWAYTRGYWRQVRVMCVTADAQFAVVSYRTASGGTRVPTIPRSRFRLERPKQQWGVVDTPAPAASPVGGA